MPTPRIHPRAAAERPNPTPPLLAGWLVAFRDRFSAPVWSRVLVLVAGAVLAPGKRTVSQALRVMGLAASPGFSRYHEVLNRARWDGRAVAHTPLMQVLGTFLPTGEVVLGVDDIIERRWGVRCRRLQSAGLVLANGRLCLQWLTMTIDGRQAGSGGSL